MISADPQEFDKLFSKDDYEKKIYNFTKQELTLITTYHAIKTMGEMAGALIDNLLNSVALPRIGIEPKKGIGTIYDNQEGTFTVYVPKNWCTVCNKLPATTRYNQKYYCDNCLKWAQVKHEMEIVQDNEKSTDGN